MTGCSARTPSAAPPLRPPIELLASCIEPQGAETALAFFTKGQYGKAAEAHVRYVLDVRDAFDLCNGQLAALRLYYEELSR